MDIFLLNQNTIWTSANYGTLPIPSSNQSIVIFLPLFSNCHLHCIYILYLSRLLIQSHLISFPSLFSFFLLIFFFFPNAYELLERWTNCQLSCGRFYIMDFCLILLNWFIFLLPVFFSSQWKLYLNVWLNFFGKDTSRMILWTSYFITSGSSESLFVSLLLRLIVICGLR